MAETFTADTKDALFLAKWEEVANRYEELNRQLVDQSVLSQPPLLHKLNKERTDIEDLAHLFVEYHELRKQEAEACRCQSGAEAGEALIARTGRVRARRKPGYFPTHLARRPDKG